MTQDSPDSKPDSRSLVSTLSPTGNPTKDRRTRLNKQISRKMMDLDSVEPTEREKLFFKFLMESGSNQRLAWERLRQSEGQPPCTDPGARGRLFLKRPGVQRLLRDHKRQVTKVLEKQLAKYAISKERVMEELVKLAFNDITDTTSWDKEGVKVKDSADIPEQARAAISEVQEIIEPGGARKVKLKHVDKTKALELIGKQLGMFKESVEHNHKHLQVTFVIEK